MDNAKNILSVLSGNKPQTIAAGLLAAVVLGVAPATVPVVPIAAILAGYLSIAGIVAAVREAISRKNRNHKIKLPPPRSKPRGPGRWIGGLLAVVIALAIMSAPGCASDHPLLSTASLLAGMDTAQPYLQQDCADVAVYPGYEVTGLDADAPVHGFGGIIGGCGRYARVSCQVRPCGDGVDDCPEVVVCRPVETLRTGP